jgi:F-type H+-transporting ATPase subunit a
MINLKPDVIFSLNNFNVTNTVISSLFVVLVLIVFFISLRYSLRPGKIQLVLEIFYENIFRFWHEITGLRNLYIFTFCLTFLIYIGFSNIIILIPPFDAFYVESHEKHIHLFRSTFSDLNMTLALAIISVVVTNLLGIVQFGIKFFKRFLSPIGLLELISEFVKIISFSFRLFGNIFAGKVLLVVISSLVVLVIPSFFIGLEIFVGIIQAFIFFVLTSIFIKVAVHH